EHIFLAGSPDCPIYLGQILSCYCPVGARGDQGQCWRKRNDLMCRNISDEKLAILRSDDPPLCDRQQVVGISVNAHMQMDSVQLASRPTTALPHEHVPV